VDSVKQFLTRPTKCSKEIDNFLSKFTSGREEVSKRIYQCKLNENIPQPPLISPMLKNFTLWKIYVQKKMGKVDQVVVANEENIPI
jgi:hypothetical protein